MPGKHFKLTACGGMLSQNRISARGIQRVLESEKSVANLHLDMKGFIQQSEVTSEESEWKLEPEIDPGNCSG